MKGPRLLFTRLLFVTAVIATAGCTVTTSESTAQPFAKTPDSRPGAAGALPDNQALITDIGALGLVGVKFENPAPAITHPMATHTSKQLPDENPSDSASSSGSPEKYAQSVVEIDGIVTGFDASSGTLEVEGIEIKLRDTTEFSDGNQYIERDAFFAELKQGLSVVIVKWRSFESFDQPPHILELGS